MHPTTTTTPTAQSVQVHEISQNGCLVVLTFTLNRSKKKQANPASSYQVLSTSALPSVNQTDQTSDIESLEQATAGCSEHQWPNGLHYLHPQPQ